MKNMQEKESIMVVRCELKIPSLGITVRHHSASPVMPNSYPRDGIFNQYLTSIKDSYNFYTQQYCSSQWIVGKPSYSQEFKKSV